jgi:hypothetical protein
VSGLLKYNFPPCGATPTHRIRLFSPDPKVNGWIFVSFENVFTRGKPKWRIFATGMTGQVVGRWMTTEDLGCEQPKKEFKMPEDSTYAPKSISLKWLQVPKSKLTVTINFS